ncbi:hypothetical protein BDZ97DRAFT_1922523 [Flammula alnicola]|nr:hypothetical protein BDZ97DRAFT_1922523 [Flammula alnicola]
MYPQLPLSLLILLGQFTISAWAAVSQVPPSTFPTLSATLSATSSLASSSTTASVNASSTSSVNTTSSASQTSSAQFPSLSGVSSCVSNCLATGISRVGCASVVDVNCFCVNTQFTPELVDCVLASCPDQVSTTENLAQQFCNIASSSPSLSFPSVPSTTTTTSSQSSSTATTPVAATSTTPSSAASGNVGNVGKGTLVGLTISALGVILGAYAVQ